MTGLNRNLVGRWLALVVGVLWFFLLIFGGLGLAFGPLGWIAALYGRRFPRLSALLLVIPCVFFIVSWGVTIVLADSASNVVQAVAVIVLLVGPALVAATFIVQGRQPAAAIGTASRLDSGRDG